MRCLRPCGAVFHEGTNMTKLTFDMLREANTLRLPTFRNALGELAK